MADQNSNPEALHNKGKGTASPTTDAFVNKGTPTAPLATFEQLQDPEISKSGSKSLRDGLIKDSGNK